MKCVPSSEPQSEPHDPMLAPEPPKGITQPSHRLPRSLHESYSVVLELKMWPRMILLPQRLELRGLDPNAGPHCLKAVKNLTAPGWHVRELTDPE